MTAPRRHTRCIALDAAGTTRDVLHADTVIDGIPIRLTDTAGIRESSEPIEAAGIRKARSAADAADLVVLVCQPGEVETPMPANVKTLRVLNKADWLREGDSLPPGLIRTVAISGQGIDELMRRIATSLFPSFPAGGEPVPLNQRQTDCLRRMVQASDLAEIASLADQLIYGNSAP